MEDTDMKYKESLSPPPKKVWENSLRISVSRWENIIKTYHKGI